MRISGLSKIENQVEGIVMTTEKSIFKYKLFKDEIRDFFSYLLIDATHSFLDSFPHRKRGSASQFQVSENGTHGLNFKFFVNSELIFEIYDENYRMKK